MFNRRTLLAGAAALLVSAAALTQFSLPALADPTEVRVMWYSDGNEGDVMRDLLDRFEKANPDIKVTLDRVPYKTINEQLPTLLDSGQGPDMARVSDLGGLSRHYLDVRPMFKNPGYFDENYATTLPWLRPADGLAHGIYGVMTQMTLTIPIVNVTLFQQAGVPLPAAGATWADWVKATRAVAEKVKAPYPIAIDRSGHRIFGPSISMGAKVFDSKGQPAILDDGFKSMMQTLVTWHGDGTMSKALWGSVGGSSYRGANEEFGNGQVVMYFSGTWQFGQFAKSVGKNFEWQAVPEPCGPATCTGLPGGAALVPIKDTKHPKEVARILEWFGSEPVQAEFDARTLFLPANEAVAAKGVDYQTDDANVKKSLNVAVKELTKTAPLAFKLQGYENNRMVFNAVISRLNQAINGEMSLTDAYTRMQADVVEGLAAKGIKLQ